jgi:class 3 adenylate cyclase/tetratricopeptide (TPR) repeat protein
LSPVQAPVGERKLVTVLFADVVGSTAMGEWIDPEDITEIMNGALVLMNDAVARHQGMVARLMGDAVLAFFGAPVARENDAERAVRAGLEIRKSAEIYAERIRQQFGVNFQVRVGINTGLAVLDIVGNQVRSEFTAMGDVVNIASRLQNAAEPGSILISHDTYRHVRGIFTLQALDPIQVKGKSEPLRVYQVQASRERAFLQPTRGVAGIETPMVGRRSELQHLQDNFYALQTNGRASARMVTILGEAGVGKSRLLYEFSNWLDQQPEVLRIFRARATEQMAHLPYSLWRDLFKAEFVIHDSDNQGLANQKLTTGISAMISAGHEDWPPIIGHLLGFNFSGNPHLEGILDDAQQIRDRAFYGAVQIFKAIMQTTPVMVFLEDIHWADEGSLDFFDHLVAECQDQPLMLVCIARDTLYDRRPGWGATLPNHERLELSLLSDQEGRELASEILHRISDIPPDLFDLIVRQAEGNPFYIEEAVQMLIDDGVIVPGPERWVLQPDRITTGKIPPTLIGLLQARLDGLPSQERSVLHRASVAGRVFWDDLTARMAESTELQTNQMVQQTQGVLTNLQHRDLIYRQDQSAFSGTTEFIFKNSILRDVTYDRLLKRMRRVYHLQVAEWLFEQSGERSSMYAGRIAEHYQAAGEAGLAAEWFTRAAKQAQDTYVPEMAKDYYQKALSLWEQAGELTREQRVHQIDGSHGLGQVLSWMGRYDEAIEALQHMIAIAQDMGDEKSLARAWRLIAETQLHQGDVRAAISSADRAESLAQNSGERLEAVKALWDKAWGSFRLGEMEMAFSLAERVSQLSQDLQDRGQMAASFNLLGVLESVSGRFQQAAEYFEQALEIFDALGNRRRAMPLMNNLGVIMESRGEYRQALSHYGQALETAREIGNRDGEMVYLSNLGGVKVRLGEHAEAESDLRLVIQMAGSKGVDVLADTYGFLAEACLSQRKVAEALIHAQHALSLARQKESLEDLGFAWRVLGKVAAASGDPISVEWEDSEPPRILEAESCFAESERIFREIEREEERARTLREWAKHKLAKGEHEQGKLIWEQAKEIFSRLGVHLEVEQMEEI